MKKEDVARIAHEVNRAYCEALGDTSQLPWNECPEWQKESVIAGVEFHAKNPDAGPEASHESWMAREIADGWIFGEEKDAELKIHPCIVPFAELPVEQQTKDVIFRAVVHSIVSVLKESPAKVVTPVVPGVVGIMYIGGRDSHCDSLYGTGLVWTPGQVHNVLIETAKRMLAHTDVYAQVDANDEVLVGPVADDDKKVFTMPAILPNLEGMDAVALKAYAQEHYGEKLAHNMKPENMRAKIVNLIGERGAK